MQLMLRLSMVNMLGKGFSFLGYRYAHWRTLHFLSSSKGNNSQLDNSLDNSPLPLTMDPQGQTLLILEKKTLTQQNEYGKRKEKNMPV